MQHAILQAYRNVLERGRYPVLVLFINIATEEVDVNVHPTKHEVRFREQSKVHQTISGSLETFLRKTPLLKKSMTFWRQLRAIRLSGENGAWMRMKFSSCSREWTAPIFLRTAPMAGLLSPDYPCGISRSFSSGRRISISLIDAGSH